MSIEVLGLEHINYGRIKALATIQIKGFGKVAGLKVIDGEHSLYVRPPNQSYTENGMRRWSNIISFERELWNEIQDKVLKVYREDVNSNVRQSGHAKL